MARGTAPVAGALFLAFTLTTGITSAAPVASGPATTTAQPAEREDDGDNTGETTGLVLIIIGGAGIAVGSGLMIAGAVLQEEPEPAFSSAGGASTTPPAEEYDDPHVLTGIGAATFVGAALVMVVGGWIRFDWSDGGGDGVAIAPYAAPGGGGVVGSF